MTNLIRKAGLGVGLAAATLTAAAPAEAQRWRGYRHYDRGGDVAAGALIGGVVGLGLGAAIANSNRGPYYGRGYYGRGYGGWGGGYYGPRYGGWRGGYYGPRCFTRWRFDPYYGERYPVRVCR